MLSGQEDVVLFTVFTIGSQIICIMLSIVANKPLLMFLCILWHMSSLTLDLLKKVNNFLSSLNSFVYICLSYK